MSSMIIDNKKYNKVGEVLRESIYDDTRLSIASAYFTIYAYNNLKNELNNIKELRFLFTKPIFSENGNTVKEKREYYLEKLEREKAVAGTKCELKLKNELHQTKIARECATWLRDKAKVKSIKNPDIVDSRLYITENQNDSNIAIQGSSDFTSEGLGFSNSPKLDLNTYIDDISSTRQYIEWFNEIWDNEELVKDVKKELLNYLEIIYRENSPEFIYFVTLYNIFRDYLDELDEDNLINAGTGIKNSVIWNKLYSFQRDGVLGAIDKLEKYNGCIIADSVGLGKTFEALAIIKYYELRNDRVLVLCPKKLRENWTIYTLNDKRNLLSEDRFNFDVLNHTDLSRYSGMSGDINLETVNWGNYDLIVIDESHNFRNNPAVADKETRYSRLMNEVIKNGVKTKVLMLSATPVNNRMNDLKNQIAFITEGDDKAFATAGIKSINRTLRKAQYAFNKWQDKPDSDRTLEVFLDMININYFKLLDTITIARSRKHIEKYYDINEVGEFPYRLVPKNIYANVDINDEFPTFAEINKEIKKLNLSIYSPLKYILLNKRQEYSEKYDKKVQGGKSVFKQVDREKSLVNLMRVNILKRMESSVYSFGVTIANILRQIDECLEKIENSADYIDEDLNINQIDIEDEEIEDMMIGNKVKILLQDMDKIKWRQDLEEDKIRLEKLLIATAKVNSNRDDKLKKLKEEIKNKVLNTINKNNKKLIIFSAFADTTEYLYKNISSWALNNFDLHSALVTGSGGNQTTLENINKDLNSILTNFAPRAKERNALYPEIDEEIDILIATDCISEGQNLQDCDYLINYDIHWNPVRIIQRFGRIDRIGSINQKIQLVNFWPNMELDEYINLEARVIGRMVLLDVSATGEENIIDYDEKKKMNDLDYRRKQLKQLQEEVVDLEEISGGISITDMTLNDFKMDLMEFMKDNHEELEKAPLGMYAITPMVTHIKEETAKGVVFCLRQLNEENIIEDSNAFHPYYLVYITDDGTVRYSYTHAKIILDLYKKLCKGKDDIQIDLISLFNQETNDGQDMSKYTSLLEKAVQDIVGKNEEKGVESLFSRGGTTLRNDHFKGLEDFELISFLIIK